MFCELVGNLNAKLLPGNDFCFCLPPMDPVLCWRLRMEYLNGYWLFKIVKFGSGGLGHCGLVWAPVNSLKSIFAFCGNERECVSLFDTHFLSLTRLLIRVSWEDTSKIVGNTITLPLSVLLVPCSFCAPTLVIDFCIGGVVIYEGNLLWNFVLYGKYSHDSVRKHLLLSRLPPCDKVGEVLVFVHEDPQEPGIERFISPKNVLKRTSYWSLSDFTCWILCPECCDAVTVRVCLSWAFRSNCLYLPRLPLGFIIQ